MRIARERCEGMEERGAVEVGDGVAGASGRRMKHQVRSVAPLTIIKMPGLKGDIPNLRLFVSIKRATQERRCPYKTNTLRRDVCEWVGGGGVG